MNYEFDFESWLDRLPLEPKHGRYSGDDITGPREICNNEWLRRGMADQFDWGEPVPIDIFIHSSGEPERRDCTKIGGVPYRPESKEWPTNSAGRSLALLAQFDFSNSHDIIGETLEELLLVFGDDSRGPIEALHFEWQPHTDENLVKSVPEDALLVLPCFGSRCRTTSFPFAKPLWDDSYPKCNGLDVWSWYHIPTYQATQIGRAPFLIQQGDTDLPGHHLCTIASVQPHPWNSFPWLNVEKPICGPDEYPADGDGNLMIGDLGCIHIMMDNDGNLKGTDSCY